MPARAAARALEGVGDFGVGLDDDPFRAEPRRDFVVGGAAKRRADFVVKRLHLLARDLGPRGVVADDGDHRDAVAHEGLELGEAPAAGAVAEQDPDFRARPRQRRRQREPRADPERPEDAGIEPAARPARAHDVGRRGDEIAPVGDEHGVRRRRPIDRAQQRDRVDALAGNPPLSVDLDLARAIARAERRDPLGMARAEAAQAGGEIF